MDRGPDPVGCLHYARELRMEAVLSNHEEKHIRWRKHEGVRAATGKENPMQPMNADRAADNAALTDDDVTWLKNLPLTLYLGGGWVAVHAGMEPAYAADKQGQNVIRVRYVSDQGKMVGFRQGSLEQPPNTVHWTDQWKGPENIVYGHDVVSKDEPLVKKSNGSLMVGIDTGCVFGGRLTALVLNDGVIERFVQVEAQRTYYSIEHA